MRPGIPPAPCTVGTAATDSLRGLQGPLGLSSLCQCASALACRQCKMFVSRPRNHIRLTLCSVGVFTNATSLRNGAPVFIIIGGGCRVRAIAKCN